MDNQQIFDHVKKVMSELFDLDASKITPESRFEELDITSIDAIDLVVELQRFTGRKVTEARFRDVRTVGDVVNLVQAHLAEGTQA